MAVRNVAQPGIIAWLHLFSSLLQETANSKHGWAQLSLHKGQGMVCFHECEQWAGDGVPPSIPPLQALQCYWGREAHVGAALSTSVCVLSVLGKREPHTPAFLISLLWHLDRALPQLFLPCSAIQMKANTCLLPSRRPRFAAIPAAHFSFPAPSCLQFIKYLKGVNDF